MFESRQLSADVSMRLLRLSDASVLTAAYARNRDYLSRWEPVRPEEYYTQEWQAADIANRLVAHRSGEGYAFGLFAGAALVGRFNVAGIVRGPFQSAGLGYWVDKIYAGRGLATAAVKIIIDAVRDEIGLHRLEASTLLDNIGSQRVLTKAGFDRIGMAPRYLQIAGKWQDHILYQVLLHD
ncbi:GNAT family N-acetyltransferase [Arthrobacter sp. H14-L1]|uniref:GNAT family N-acetyltransferase n=1 Tax=Arthrobacter sp. H14-L1 TaxID=2996697 RepID=UPI002271EE60|nr:GNAT family N-acetyltransferase [Arthrobacter sp. H14-L1]MCY0906177.1 GNAT family N-acetyltransferase [Arthrobacter sp. H14-L1]